jgi:hypothetical protein
LENDKKALKIKEKTRPLKDNLFSINKLFSTINIHTKEYIDKEIAFFKKYPTDKTDKIIDSLNAIKKEIAGQARNDDSQNVCILKMSAGSGFHSITGDWQYDDYSQTGQWTEGRNGGKKKYKSRKIAIQGNDFSLMGFVKLRTMTDEEVNTYEQKLSEEKAKEIAEQQRIAEENRLAEEQRRNEEAKLQKYEQKVLNAQSLYGEDKLEEAKDELEKASLLCPAQTQHTDLYNKIVSKIQKIEERKIKDAELKANAERAVAERLVANQVPLAEKIRTATKIPTMVGNVQTWMKLNNITDLSETDLLAIREKLFEILNSMKPRDKKPWENFSGWKSIIELVGEQIASKWFTIK